MGSYPTSPPRAQGAIASEHATPARGRGYGERIDGHGVETRLYAEDVPARFLPATGSLHRFRIPDAPGSGWTPGGRRLAGRHLLRPAAG